MTWIKKATNYNFRGVTSRLRLNSVLLPVNVRTNSCRWCPKQSEGKLCGLVADQSKKRLRPVDFTYFPQVEQRVVEVFLNVPISCGF